MLKENDSFWKRLFDKKKHMLAENYKPEINLYFYIVLSLISIVVNVLALKYEDFNKFFLSYAYDFLEVNTNQINLSDLSLLDTFFFIVINVFFLVVCIKLIKENIIVFILGFLSVFFVNVFLLLSVIDSASVFVLFAITASMIGFIFLTSKIFTFVKYVCEKRWLKYYLNTSSNFYKLNVREVLRSIYDLKENFWFKDCVFLEQTNPANYICYIPKNSEFEKKLNAEGVLFNSLEEIAIQVVKPLLTGISFKDFKVDTVYLSYSSCDWSPIIEKEIENIKKAKREELLKSLVEDKDYVLNVKKKI